MLFSIWFTLQNKNYKQIEQLNAQNSKYRDELNQTYRDMDKIRDKQSITSKTAAPAFKKLEASAGKVAKQRSEASATAKSSK